MNLEKQNVEQEDLDQLVTKLSEGFNAPIEVIKSLRVDYADFLHYMQTLVNPYNSNVTLDCALSLFELGYYVNQ